MVHVQSREQADVPQDVLHIPSYLHQSKDGSWFAEYDAVRLRSTFQPIYRRSCGTLEVAGFEGLVRSVSAGVEAKPQASFTDVPGEEQFLVDRICRAIHFRNFAIAGGGGQTIFVNMLPMTREQHEESAFDFNATPDRLKRFGLDTRQVVIEITETDEMDFSVVLEIAEMCREMGMGIAIGCFGHKPSSAEHLAELQPDFVKPDPLLSRRAASGSELAELMRSLIGSATQAGAEVILDGITSRNEMEFAVSTKSSLFQGSFLSAPHPRPQFAATRLNLDEIGMRAHDTTSNADREIE